MFRKQILTVFLRNKLSPYFQRIIILIMHQEINSINLKEILFSNRKGSKLGFEHFENIIFNFLKQTFFTINNAFH